MFVVCVYVLCKVVVMGSDVVCIVGNSLLMKLMVRVYLMFFYSSLGDIVRLKLSLLIELVVIVDVLKLLNIRKVISLLMRLLIRVSRVVFSIIVIMIGRL